ncbi:TlyA family RNA methyltransferase [Galactobacter valiniphilus]|uniref:TlyA family RNA methyltransferase n=1 Tax=Galactobacter valiniphilus TaxID=2676122 RepID=UPI001F386A74|nr:TlyA family RNA methyltransferase [Galactobacter valiniphilus]
MSGILLSEPDRLDVALVKAGLFPSRTRAAKAVAAGRVSLDGAVITRASQAVAAGQELSVASDEADHWVGRAAHKLLGALDTFSDVDPRGALCLDAGASTGGFTQVLLERGARLVHAVDVGHDQLHPDIAADPRVRNHEGVNVRALTADFVDGGVDLVVGDLSFISLTLVVAPLASVLRPGGEALLMVKPQFEVGREKLSRTGVVSSPLQRREAVEAVLSAARAAGLEPRGIGRSQLAGQDGNAEFFVRLLKPADPAPSTPPAGDAASPLGVMLDAVDYR